MTVGHQSEVLCQYERHGLIPRLILVGAYSFRQEGPVFSWAFAEESYVRPFR